jgi:hypothetical protein
MRMARIGVAFITVTLWAAAASADVFVVTSGLVRLNPSEARSSFDLQAPGLFLGGDGIPMLDSMSFASGDSVTMTGHVDVRSTVAVPQTLPSNLFEPLFLFGTLSIVGDPFDAPSAPPATLRSFATTALVLGHLDAFTTANGSGLPVFSVDVVGGGRFTQGLFASSLGRDGRTLWTQESGKAQLDVGELSATPEPASALLLATGLMASALGWRKARFQRSQTSRI